MEPMRGTCRHCSKIVTYIRALNGDTVALDPPVVVTVDDVGRTLHGRIPHALTCTKRETTSPGKRAVPL